MKGIVCSGRATTLSVALCSLLFIQSIEGNVWLWSSHVSYEKQSTDVSLPDSNDTSQVASGSEDVTTALENVTVRSSVQLLAGTNPRVTEIYETTYEEGAISFPHENINRDEDSDKEKDEDNRNRDNDDYVEADNTNTNTTISMERIDSRIIDYDTDSTNISDDDLIAEALKNGVLLPPELFGSLKPNSEHDDINTYPKTSKSRSPKQSNEVDPQMTTSADTDDDQILFPDDQRLNTSAYDFFMAPVPTCKGRTYCETVPYYPPVEIKDMALKKNYIPPIRDPDVNRISQRMGPDDPTICRSNPQPILPRSGLDENKAWRYIVNDETYEQRLQVEICEDECERCHNVIPDGLTYTTYCEQKYIYRTLVVYKLNAPEVELAPIKIPSSCCCNIRHTGDSSVKMKLDDTMKECVVDSLRVK